MDEKKRRWTEYKSWKKGYYHLCTDGWKAGRLFHTDAQFAAGMTTVGLMTLLHPVKIYAFELMPNHLHIVLSGTGADCFKAFCFLKRRINARLVRDGFPPLPETYDFKLIPIEDEQQLKNNILYVARNSYEKQYASPGGYPWGSSYLYHSVIACFWTGTRIGDMSRREVKRLTGSEVRVPEDWLYLPDLGILPVSFIVLEKFYKLFPTPKDYMTALVKDYESFSRIAAQLDERLSFGPKEAEDMTRRLLDEEFDGKRLRDMLPEEKYRLARRLREKYALSPEMIGHTVFLPDHIVRQILHSKEYAAR